MKREPPFHKQLNTSKQAGQNVDRTLGDYISRKSEKKLTFDEWYNQNNWMWDFDTDTPTYVSIAVENILQECWKAAQENV